jgi:hypothetical protein
MYRQAEDCAAQDETVKRLAEALKLQELEQRSRRPDGDMDRRSRSDIIAYFVDKQKRFPCLRQSDGDIL